MLVEAIFHTKDDEEKEMGEQHEAKGKLLEEFERLNVVPGIIKVSETENQKQEVKIKIMSPPVPSK